MRVIYDEITVLRASDYSQTCLQLPYASASRIPPKRKGARRMLQNEVGFTNPDEVELVGLAKGGDDEAFEELIRRCYGKCRQLAASILRDSAEAEDITQNCCLRAHRLLHQFRGESSFAAWLARIVVNEARTVLKCRHRYRTVSIDETIKVHGKAPGTLHDFSKDPEQQLAARQIHVILSREIDLIPKIFRKVIVLRDLREMPIAEIASKLNLPLQTVKARLFRGRKELRSRMLKRCGDRMHALLTN